MLPDSLMCQCIWWGGVVPGNWHSREEQYNGGMPAYSLLLMREG